MTSEFFSALKGCHISIYTSKTYECGLHIQNENRYNVGKGTHLVLKRAEKARALVSKMPGD